MSSLDQLKESVEFIRETAGDEDYIIAEDISDEQEEAEYDIGEVPISRGLRDQVRRTLRKKVEQQIKAIESDSKPLIEYDISNHNRDTTPVQYLPRSEIPHVTRVDPVFEELDIDKKRPRSGESLDFEFQAFRMRHGSGRMAIVLQNFTGHQILGRSKKFTTMLGEGARQEYDQFRNELMTIPERVDAIYYNGHIFVFDPMKFEKIFDYFDHYEEQANAVFAGLDGSDITIHGFDEFQKSVRNDNRALRKMHEIEERGLYEELSREQVEEVIDSYNLRVSVEERNGDWGIILPTLRQKWEVLRLLNDDHLYSSLTEGRYQVYQKDER